MTKRAFDVASSALGLVLLSPLLGCIALLLRVCYGPPVIFRQARVGLNGTSFQLHKFRTMTLQSGPLITAGQDPRIHPVGKALRDTKLDELPQLWDVLRGQMSVVGPRPEVPALVQHWPPLLRPIILSVRPGITDPASVRFRNESAILDGYDDPERAYIEILLPMKCQTYAEYVEGRSMVKDLEIIYATFRALLRTDSSKR